MNGINSQPAGNVKSAMNDQVLISREVFGNLARTLQGCRALYDARSCLLRYVSQQMPYHLSQIRKMTEKYSPVRANSDFNPAAVQEKALAMGVTPDSYEKQEMTREVLEYLRPFLETS